MQKLNHTLLLSMISNNSKLKLFGIHGIKHWKRVCQIGTSLAAHTGADLAVVTAFSWVHDARRYSDGLDLLHGNRGAAFARRINYICLFLNHEQLELLCRACEGHSYGEKSRNQTIGTCWDADRLDLSRLDVQPDTALLSTVHARKQQFIAWACSLSDNEEYDNKQI